MAKRLTRTDKLVLGRMGGYPRYYNKRRNIEAGICPFCTINPKVNVVLFENDQWVIWEVPQNLSRKASILLIYLLIVPKKPFHSLANKDPSFWIQFGEMVDWAYANYDIPGGMLNIRLGDPIYSAATEKHPHWNLKVPNLTDEVRETIAKTPEQVAGNKARGERFSKFYTAGVTPAQWDDMLKHEVVSKDGHALRDLS